MKNITTILLVSFLLASCTQSVLILRNFPPEKEGHLLYGADNQRNFYVPVTISDSLELKWENSTHGSYNHSSVTVYDKYVITHDLSGGINCFDFDSGKELGVLKFSGSINTAPVVYKTRMFFIVNNLEEEYSTAYYYDLVDGKILSQVDLPGSYSNQLVMNGNAFYAISDNGVISRFNFAGYNEWLFETKLNVLSTPAMVEDKILFTSVEGEFVVFNVEKKIIELKKKISSGFSSGVVISGTEAYTCDANGIVYCLNINDGSVKWKADTGYKIMSLPVYDKNNLYVTNVSGYITCFERTNGKIKWQVKLGGAPIATPLLVNNYLIQPNMNAHLYLINTSDGSIKKDIKFAGRMKYSPVLYNNLLILGFDKGNISAFEITEVK